jgi:hypothetical protein
LGEYAHPLGFTTTQNTFRKDHMKVKEILSDVNLVIAQIEVQLNGELRTSPTLCALIPAKGSEQEKIVPLNTPDGRPIFMNIENAIKPFA